MFKSLDFENLKIKVPLNTALFIVHLSLYANI
jgi:hypothetical protein